MDLSSHRTIAADYLAIAAGGAVGSLARHWIATALPPAPAAIPWATLIANLVGSFALGYVARAGILGRRQLLFVSVGVIASFTTFSTLAGEIAQRGADGYLSLAAGYAAATVVCGLLAAWAGAELAIRRAAGGADT